MGIQKNMILPQYTQPESTLARYICCSATKTRLPSMEHPTLFSGAS